MVANRNTEVVVRTDMCPPYRAKLTPVRTQITLKITSPLNPYTKVTHLEAPSPPCNSTETRISPPHHP